MATTRTFTPAIALLMLSLGASASYADAIIDFGTGSAGKGGSMSFAGGTAPLVGAGIRIGLVTGVGTPANDDSHAITGNALPYGVLNFTTGAYEGYSAGAYQFGAGGTFQLFGNVPDASLSDSGSGALLFSGVFSSATIGRIGALDFFSATGTDVYENPALVTYFGLPTTTLFDFSSYVTATGSLGAGSAFLVNPFSTDWANPDPPAEDAAFTPEPAGLVLLGSGLAMLGARLRRRRSTATE